MTLNETEAENVKGGAVDMFLRLDGIRGETEDTRAGGNIGGYDTQTNIKI